jgi:gas vesicle protein
VIGEGDTGGEVDKNTKKERKMKKKIGLLFIMVIMLLSPVLMGCEGGIAQELYDQVMTQLNQAKEQLEKAQEEKQEIQETKEQVQSAYDKAEEKIDELETLINSLKSQYELAEGTPAEIAEKIVKNYHDTHVYSKTDLFICSDMSAEVWNMLKAQGISAVIVVGDKDGAISDIIYSDHAWVLAEVGSGEYLALETTGGHSVSKDENPYYYQGWTFSSPYDLNSYNNLVREYNVRVSIRNRINDEANAVAEEHNQSTNPTTAERLKAVYDKLVELREEQEDELNKIKAEIDSLATAL